VRDWYWAVIQVLMAARTAVEHDLPVDVQTGSDDSCLGRMARAGGVDGVYTKGSVGNSAQLIYTPLYNAIDPAMPPAPSLLKLPGGLIADAIAAARNPDNSSDLYVAARGSLYWFASTNQKNQATGVLVATSPLLAAVRNLYAYTADGQVTVWGLNGDDQVFYLTCPAGQQQAPAAWNVPLTILTGVDAISPFIDRNYNANTFFAHSGTGLVKVVKSPTTKLWNSRNITLPPAAATQPATAIHSYTTHIQVTDASGQQAPNPLPDLRRLPGRDRGQHAGHRLAAQREVHHHRQPANRSDRQPRRVHQELRAV
jgi:hypothetical protein